MKYIKLFENFKEQDIHEICKEHGITNYTINDDGSIDVDDDVYLSNKGLTKLPLKFRNVNSKKLISLEGSPVSVGGNFYCSHNKLISLEGSPVSVGGNFYCYDNKLTSLKGSPKSVGGHFNCNNNQLTSLEGSAISVGGGFFCYENKLTSLKGSPKSVGGDFICSRNKLTSLEGGPKSVGGDFSCRNNDIIDFIGFVEPVGNFYCEDNPIYKIWKLFGNKEHIELLNDYDCIRGKDIVIDRLNMFLEEIDKPTVRSVDGYNNI